MTTITEKHPSKGQAWFCTTGLPSDIIIEVDQMRFHLHKFPLMSKSKKLHQLITDQESKEKVEEGDLEEVEEHESLNITFKDVLGGSDTFETAAKFCYGVKIDINSANVALLRCAAEFLEMSEEYSEGNLISKAEMYLNQSVLRNRKEAVKTLQSCESKSVMPYSESLKIIERCIDSIVSRADESDLSLLGWPVNERQGEGNQYLWNGIETGKRRHVGSRSGNNNNGLLEDLAQLSSPTFKRVIATMKTHDFDPEIMERSLLTYARKSFPGLSRSSRRHSAGTTSLASETEQRDLLKFIIINLPIRKSRKSSTKHLFGLLKIANILSASESCRRSLERKIALQLEQATLDDLLITSYSYLIETLYDIDCAERILRYFLEDLEERSVIELEGEDAEENAGSDRISEETNGLLVVGKLTDGYLAEIASDTNLKMDKFCDIAYILPDLARQYDDGLYRAVDVYLKAHPWFAEEDREKICQVMDYQKLTLVACTHATQNERLPLRVIVQVLFFEQLQLRQAIHCNILTNGINPYRTESARPSILRIQQPEREDNVERQNHALRQEMDSMSSRVQELERNCSTMNKVIANKLGSEGKYMDKVWRTTFAKKFGCKFKTQVCDLHERTVIDSRKSRHHRQTST